MFKLKYYTLYFMLGGISYWLSNIFITIILYRFVLIWLMLLTFLVPCIVILIYLYIQKRIGNQLNIELPLLMLLGIWMIAPFGISVSLISMGGKFLETGNFKYILNLWAKDGLNLLAGAPLYVFVGSGYSGCIGGLVLTTIFFILFYIDAKIKSNRTAT